MASDGVTLVLGSVTGTPPRIEQPVGKSGVRERMNHRALVPIFLFLALSCRASGGLPYPISSPPDLKVAPGEIDGPTPQQDSQSVKPVLSIALEEIAPREIDRCEIVVARLRIRNEGPSQVLLPRLLFSERGDVSASVRLTEPGGVERRCDRVQESWVVELVAPTDFVALEPLEQKSWEVPVGFDWLAWQPLFRNSGTYTLTFVLGEVGSEASTRPASVVVKDPDKVGESTLRSMLALGKWDLATLYDHRAYFIGGPRGGRERLLDWSERAASPVYANYGFYAVAQSAYREAAVTQESERRRSLLATADTALSRVDTLLFPLAWAAVELRGKITEMRANRDQE